MFNKRGQFYLIATLAIVTVVARFLIITNQVSSVQNPTIGYLKDEINIESSNVIGYGIANGLSYTDIEDKLANLSYYYINNSAESNLYFLYGTTSSLTLIAYQSKAENVFVNDNPVTITAGVTYKGNGFTPEGDTIDININDTSYNFKINSGENFHFAIKSLSGNQVYAIEG